MTKKLLLTLVAAFMAVGALQAQKTPMVVTVNMGELYQNYWKAQEADQKFQSSVENAQQEIQAMIEEGMGLANEMQELQSKMNNPALTETAREKFTAEAQQKAQSIREKEAEVNRYRQQTEQTLQQRRQSIVQLHISEIREEVIKIAKEKGADLVLNSAGMAVVYFDESFDITQEVLAKLNADKGSASATPSSQN
ncbi:OmpH family outer membrane protein [Ruficoccus amylovorans]|uniref:OmpH family outer membrane protein n=1 Tax=Ruficoccus amylovorans TaxID=1804625 RepID=A0A842HIE3_9BACT|nr:OmpH family outer membrane protein [Ruficoccus amylovorans]MBC2596182.1 OmpH family outer membrane protein [Ruficoccus amylovorans]